VTAHPFYIVDVFAEAKYAGNQLAVFRDAGGISDADMQRFAKEMNYSETTFIGSETPRDGGYDVRIFTPEAEVPFAGHPTLGTAFVIQREILASPVERLVLHLPIGSIPVSFTYREDETDVLWMQQKPPTFGPRFEAAAVAPVLGLDPNQIDARFPVQEVSTGLPFLIVPLTSLDAVKRAGTVRERYLDLVRNTRAKSILIFCPETVQAGNALHVRVFADYFGVPEDPATGSANGCLAGYLVQHEYFGTDRIDLRVEQGYAIGRPSLLYLQAQESGETIEVAVGGKVVMVARGEFV
jgi:trans-2,3-dihydro-3-hydroxyanthranilate isomerase